MLPEDVDVELMLVFMSMRVSSGHYGLENGIGRRSGRLIACSTDANIFYVLLFGLMVLMILI